MRRPGRTFPNSASRAIQRSWSGLRGSRRRPHLVLPVRQQLVVLHPKNPQWINADDDIPGTFVTRRLVLQLDGVTTRSVAGDFSENAVADELFVRLAMI